MNEAFSKALKKLRSEKGLSQQDLAESMYVTRPTVARWESGARLPDAAMIKRLAEVLCVDIDYLLSSALVGQELPNVILVDDRKLVLNGGLLIVEEALPHTNVVGFTDGEKAIEYAKSNRVALALLDIELRGMSGLTLCHRLLEINPRTNVVFTTAYDQYALDAWDTGACGFLLKPITVDLLKEQLKKLRYPFYAGEGEA